MRQYPLHNADRIYTNFRFTVSCRSRCI